MRFFCARQSYGARIRVTFISPGVLATKTAAEPQAVTWNATYVGRSDDDGYYNVVYDKRPEITLHLPPDRDEFLVLGIAPLPQESFPCAAGTSRTPLAYRIKHPDTAIVPDLVVYFDGGYSRATKISNCAIVAQLYVSEKPMTFTYTKKFTQGSNNCTEHLSLVAALRIVKYALEGKLHHGATITNCAIVGDSQLALQQCIGTSAASTPHIKLFVDEEDKLKGGISRLAPKATVQYFHVLRQYNKLADNAGRRAMADNSFDDPLNLFEWDTTIWPTVSVHGAEVDSAAADAAAAAVAAPGDDCDIKMSYTPDEVRQLRTFPCLDSVPLEAASAWASIVFGQVSSVVSAPNDKAMSDAFSRLLVLPVLYLPTHIAFTKLICNLKEKRHTVRKQTTVDHSTQDEDSRRTRKALRYAGRGFLRQATKCFAPSAVARVDEPVIQNLLKQKVLSVDTPVFGDGARSPSEAPDLLTLFPSVPPLMVRLILKSMNPVAASGMDRWNSALILCATENSEGLLDLLARLMVLMLSKWKLFEPFCVLARGIALVKKDSIRPIGIAGFFVKLLSATCLKMDDPARCLPTWQHGHAKDGCFRVIRDVRARLEHPDSPSCLVTVDAENAFNSITRQACWDSLYKRVRLLQFTAAFFRLTYSSPTSIGYQHSGNQFFMISCNVGVRQGCPISSFIYNLATSDLLEPAVAALPAGSGFYALHDDLTIACQNTADAIAAFDNVSQILATGGLKVNKTKCEFVAPASWPADEGAAMAGSRSLRYVHASTDSVRILGAHVGAAATMSAYVETKTTETTTLMSTVTEALGLIEPRACISILRYCCQPKMLYCLITHPPAVTIAHARTYRVALVACLKAFLGEDINEDLIFSTFGLSFIDYAPAVSLLYEKFLRNSADLGLRDEPLRDFLTSKDSAVLTTHHLLKARLGGIAAGMTGSVSWCSPFVPTTPVAQPYEVLQMLRHALLVDTRSTEPCYCGRVDDGIDKSFLEHILVCDKIRGATRVFRHNNVLSAMEHHLRAYGAFVTLEPRFYSYADGSRKRPDITVHNTQPPISTDLVISVDMTSAIEQKNVKHKAAINDMGHAFVPIAMSIWGEHHASVDAFLKRAFRALPKNTMYLAILKTKRAMSEAWLVGTIAMIRGVVQRDLSRLEMARRCDDDELSRWAP